MAVLIVLLSHLSLAHLSFHPALDFSGGGQYGVFLFFTLSSFLLTVMMLNGDFKDPRCWGHYLLRRLFRIFPLYLTVLLVCLAGAPYFTPISFPEFWRHLALQEGKNVFWTIAVEFKFYLVLPFILLSTSWLIRRSFTAAVLALFLSAVVISIFVGLPSEAKVHDIHLLPYLPIFLLGIFAAVIHLKAEERGGIQSDVFKILLEWVGVLALLVVFATFPPAWKRFTGHWVSREHFHHQILLYATAWTIVLFSALHGSGFLKSVLSLKAVRFFGAVSYSIYLWHMPVRNWVNDGIQGPAPLKALLVLMIVTAVSTLSFLLIERPFLRWGRRRQTQAVFAPQPAQTKGSEIYESSRS